jgi:hypothetical protein
VLAEKGRKTMYSKTLMTGKNDVGKIIPPVAVFKGRAYRSEFAVFRKVRSSP